MVNSLADVDETLNTAFLLAYFIHGSRETAVRIVTGAMAKLEVTASAQGKRLYYHPVGRLLPHRSRSNAFRNKVSFSELHLLQRLIYAESEPYEKQQEQVDGAVLINEEEMIVRFVKHLVRVTVRRNSFYVTLGISRLLYNYSTANTMQIYNVIIQDPERVKDDYYFRSRKAVLMQELKERFGDFVNVCRGPRGEERFESSDHTGRHHALVTQSLNLFAPWHTPCLVPAGFDPLIDEIPGLSFRGPDAEDHIEVNRMHATLHPACYQRLTNALGFDSPDRRLEIPRFFFSKSAKEGSTRHSEGGHQGGSGHDGGGNDDEDGRDGDGNDRHQPPELGAEDLNAVKRHLAEQSVRRKRASAGQLRVVVDGVERARLDLMGARQVRFELDGSAELIEVRAVQRRGGDDDEVLLATHFLAHDEDADGARPSNVSITLEGGQKLSIATTAAGSAGTSIIELTYRETNLLRAAALFSRQLFDVAANGGERWPAINNSSRRNKGVAAKVVVPVVALLICVACAVGVMRYVQNRSSRAAPPFIAGDNIAGDKRAGPSVQTSDPATLTAPETDAAPATVNNSQSHVEPSRNQNAFEKRERLESRLPRISKTQNSRERGSTIDRNKLSMPHPDVVEPDRVAPEETSAAVESTRSLEGKAPPTSLRAVRKIYVEFLGDESLNEEILRILIDRLRTDGRLTLASSRDDADALLKVSTEQARRSSSVDLNWASVSVRLVNAAGDVMWPARQNNSRSSYTGAPARVAAEIVQDLLVEVRKADQQ
ncbi:MAG: hypothetical protein H0W76_01820 [Pyrinomonadaceae bacterium]|nr:hypothetical protein [Pyrinomonadaceae bacterium]